MELTVGRMRDVLKKIAKTNRRLHGLIEFTAMFQDCVANAYPHASDEEDEQLEIEKAELLKEADREMAQAMGVSDQEYMRLKKENERVLDDMKVLEKKADKKKENDYWLNELATMHRKQPDYDIELFMKHISIILQTDEIPLYTKDWPMDVKKTMAGKFDISDDASNGWKAFACCIKGVRHNEHIQRAEKSEKSRGMFILTTTYSDKPLTSFEFVKCCIEITNHSFLDIFSQGFGIHHLVSRY
jgi:hypothetical protein